MISAGATVGNLAYSYDSNGNRLSFLDNGETKTYSYSPNTNRLTQVGSKEVTQDAAGNTVSDRNGKRHFEYLASGRLFKVYKERKQVATYLYNNQGLRTQKVTKHGTTVYHYDLAGHLIAETSKTGDLIRAYVWLDDMPLAQIDVKGKEHDHRRKPRKERITYLHTDHLGTPRLATDTNQAIVWRWDSDAFGSEKPEHEDEETDDHKDITVNLRFAGQYFDKETKLHYNWNRYYDPKTGRYVTSDPIGIVPGLTPALLGGAESFMRPVSPWFATELLATYGLNHPYAYVRNNPNRWADPSGLIDLGICGSTALQRLLIPEGSFGPACQRHDDCYATCGKAKWTCDYQLLKDTQAECEKLPKGSVARNWCFSKSTEFFLAVGKYGQSAYDKAQKEAKQTTNE